MIAPTDFDRFLPDYLARQPWFAHGRTRAAIRSGVPVDVGAVVRDREVWRDGDPGLIWAIVDATLDGVVVGAYQVLVGVRPSKDPPGFLIGATSRVLGTISDDDGDWLVYDALVDPELTAIALAEMFEDLDDVRSVRKLTVGKTSTSVVADERWLCKVFRRARHGVIPGVDMPAQLWAQGFRATLETVESWHHADMDLALRRPFLPGAANGFDLAEASLRELFASGLDPQLSPGDFSAEARRIGSMLADMHNASERAYGVTAMSSDALVDEIARQIVRLDIDGLGSDLIEQWAKRRRDEIGPQLSTIRVHGNLHLGQLLRSDLGWLILDFEGAPLLPAEERRRPLPGWFDVASMLRSFDYVVAMTRAARVDSELDGDTIAVGASAWMERNTGAFLDGYRAGRRLGDEAGSVAAVQIGEVARAVYEVAYERANRPEMEAIPVAALKRLVGGPVD
ncbi:MAG: hypothetical protein JST73_07225 [Actinobacteria bacterium]|nr:hypothetical protein [Actinomycetota bacterium]